MSASPISSVEQLHDQYRAPRAGWFTRLLWWCAGADPLILGVCPNSDQVKYQGLGGIVLATGVLAFLSGTYAFYMVFGSEITATGARAAVPYLPAKAVAAGFVWSLVIFNIDRFIVSSSGHGDGTDRITGRELLNGIPRILMALIIGFVLSKPLEVRVFQAEVEGKLAEEISADAERRRLARVHELELERDNRIADVQRQLREAQATVVSRRQQLTQATETRDRQIETVNRETMGDAGSSGRAGYGPRAAALNAELARQNQEVERLTASVQEGLQQGTALEREILTLRDQFSTRMEAAGEAAKADARTMVRDGLIRRIDLAHQLAPWGTFALTVLLWMIELGPILFKMMVIKGPYDYLSDDLKRVILARAGIEERVVPGSAAGGAEGRAEHVTLHHRALHELGVRKRSLEREEELGRLAVDERAKQLEASIRESPAEYVVTKEKP
jgi:hypothetical protein